MKFVTLIAISTLSIFAAAPAFASGDDSMAVDQRYESQVPRTANPGQVEMRKSDAPVAREFRKAVATEAMMVNQSDQAGNR